MQLFNTRLFDDFIVGTNSVYTSEEQSPIIAGADALVLMAVVDQVSASATFTLDIEHSGDNRNFVPKYPAPVLSASIDNTQTWVLTASDPGFLPSLGFVRLVLSVSTGSAHVRVTGTGRVWSSQSSTTSR